MNRKVFAFAVIIGLLLSATSAQATLLDGAPFIPQSPPGDWNKNMNCGPTSALMVAAYHLQFEPTAGDTMSIVDWLYHWDYISPQANAEYYDGNVTSISQLKDILEVYYQFSLVSSQANSNIDFIRDELSAGNPVIVGVNIQMDPQRLGHFMVAVGIEGEELIVHDPGKTHGAFLRYSLDDFDRSWRTSNRSALVVHDDNNAVSWHPNDSLIKVAGDPRVYLLIGGSAFWIFDEDVFNAHNFDWQRILTVSQRELSCYQYGGEISWEPYREVFQVNSRIYLMERQSADSESCAYYQFSSEFSFNTWKIPGALRNLAEPVARAEYYNRCNFGGVLYSRAGTLIKPSFDLPGYGSGVIFFVTGNGELMPFDGWEVFNLMGYSRQVYWLANEEQFNSSVSSLGQMISMESASQCLMDGLLSVAGVAEVESTDSDGDGSGIEEGDCDDNNARIFPGAEEVCDGLDNDCDGAVDVGSWCPADCSCVNGQCTMILDEEEFQIPNENPPEEPAESLPEEAIDDEEPESEEEPVEEEEVSLPEEESPALENPPEEEVESAENVPEEAIDDEGVEREEENEASDEIDLSVRCTITCPAGMRAYAWYSADKSAVGNPAVIDSDIDEICLRGNSWIDFNCACIAPHEWSCYDWRAANVSCNHEIDIIPGQIDPRGEGEIWFRDFQCFE